MKLVSLKRSESEDKEDEKEEVKGCCAGEMKEPDYPWGTCITLDEETLVKLGITSLPAVGAPAVVESACTIKAVREDMIEGKAVRSVELQITDIGLAMAGASASSLLFDKTKK